MIFNDRQVQVMAALDEHLELTAEQIRDETEILSVAFAEATCRSLARERLLERTAAGAWRMSSFGRTVTDVLGRLLDQVDDVGA